MSFTNLVERVANVWYIATNAQSRVIYCDNCQHPVPINGDAYYNQFNREIYHRQRCLEGTEFFRQQEKLRETGASFLVPISGRKAARIIEEHERARYITQAVRAVERGADQNSFSF